MGNISIKQYTCPICGASKDKYIGIRNNHYYCRRCISFRGEESIEQVTYPKIAPIYIDYELSEDQKKLSSEILENYKNGINTLVHAVCGSGKTEIVLEVIKYAIKCGERVGFAIPRKDVVIEICERFTSIFKRNSVISVYGGHNENTVNGDLIVLTTHQLYRYYHYFDLLIMDEIDAFPFKNNEVLDAFFHRAIKGHYVLMSATPSIELLELFKEKGFDVVELFSRFHKHPLPVPKLVVANNIILFYKLISLTNRYIKEKKQVMVFSPTIESCEETYLKMKYLCHGGDYVHSKREGRPTVIDNFRKGKITYIVTTAVLERGVTVKNVQVIIYHAENSIYDHHALIQISGRVGRKKDAPEGEVIFLATKSNDEITKSISEIKRANASLQNMF